MTCVMCKHGRLTPGHTSVLVERDDTTIVVRGAPADVCETCGEEHLEARVAAAIEDVLRGATAAGVRFEVREYAAA